MKKKVLYVITKSVWGGAQKYVFDLATNLPRDKFETIVAAGGNGLLLQKLQSAGVKTISIPYLERDVNPVKEPGSFFGLLKIFLAEKPDVIHLNSSKIGGIGAIAASFYKLLTLNFKPLTIFTVHGWGFKEDRKLWQCLLIFLASFVSTLFHNKVILINKSDFKTARKFIPRRKLALIKNGISAMKFLQPEKAREFLAPYTSQKNLSEVLLLGTIAELTKNKGIVYLIEAVKILRSEKNTPLFKTIIIGVIENGEYKNLVLNQIKSLGLENIVFITGFIEDAYQYLKGFDIFILPSLKEGLPYTIMQAMAAGLPVVATKVGGVPDLIKDQENGLLAPAKNPEALANALSQLLSDRNKRDFLGRHAAKTAESDFSLRDMIFQTINIYHESR